ncbi:unnamed protein product [Laminaria digitata]
MSLPVAWRRKLSMASRITHVSMILQLLLVAVMVSAEPAPAAGCASLAPQAFVPPLGVCPTPGGRGLAPGDDQRSRHPGSAAAAAAAASTRHFRSRSKVKLLVL